ncbi:DUF58 domain-containing protein [Lentzea sp. NPDC058436]|uniref:DUF58 domain-containing protein n=1 Tax=Lentzea sp. NPDC058436 TaxID=3346499 RepID=UPI003657986E
MRLTATGWGLAIAASVLIAAGLSADYPEVTALGATAATLLLAAAVWTARRPNVSARRELQHHRVREGQPIRCRLVVHNDSARPSPELDVVDGSGEEPVRLVLGGLPAQASDEVEYQLPTRRRGVYTAPPPAIELTDPVRLLRRSRRDGSPDTYYVHPDYRELPGFGAGGPLDIDGEALTPRRDGSAFYSLRSYVPGDERRLIHWPSTARTGELVVRHLSAPDAPECLVVLDTTATPYADGRFEEAVRVTASLCVSALDSGARLTLRTTGDLELRCAAKAEHGEPLDFLAGVDLAPQRLSWAQAVVGDREWSDALVVSGALAATEVGKIAAAGPPVLVVQLGPAPFSTRVVSGATVVTARTCAEFADHWNG